MSNGRHNETFEKADGLMAELLDQYLPCQRLRRGQVVRGTVIRVETGLILIDMGAKCEGSVTGQEFERVDPDLLAALKPGDEVSAYVIDPEGPQGEVVLSLARAQQDQSWGYAESLMEREQVLELEAVASNQGGVIVRVGSVRGFVPASQLDPGRRVPRISDPSCSEVLAGMVGSALRLQVIEVDRNRNRLILSERAALYHGRKDKIDHLLNSLKKGEVCKGCVSNLTHFGAFVDLGGLDGLLHLSEISWHPVDHPGDVLALGDEIEVMVLNINHERQQIALSMKRLEADPWETVSERYTEGQLVQARVTRLAKWGAFARIVGDEAIEGLIHVSELDEQRVVHPRDVVRQGEVVTLRVVRVEPERHRLALSLKQGTDDAEVDADWRAEYAEAERPPRKGALESAFDEALQA